MGTLDFDLFVIFATADAAFVRGYLLPALGEPRVLTVDDLQLGHNVVAEIERGISRSRYTLTVLSPAYLADRWGLFGEQLATLASLDDSRVVPLKLVDTALPLHIEARVSLDFRAGSDWEHEIARLRKLLDTPSGPTVADIPCPYPGMRPFTEADAARFYGRTAEIADVTDRLRRGEREVFVIGPSGSGKSSLLSAAVLPRLRTTGKPWPCITRTLRPGADPLARLREVLEAGAVIDDAVVALLARSPGTERLVLCVDQLEELFTTAAPDARNAFIEAIRVLRSNPSVVMLYALRADFYGSLMESPLWADLGTISRVEVAPLQGAALRAAIEDPARDVGVHLEAALSARLLVDSASEPGALPLLQETLVLLWEKRHHRLLRLVDYDALGDDRRSGLAVALARRADTALRALSTSQQGVARRVLLRLVSFGEGRPNTRRQQSIDVLAAPEQTSEDFATVVRHLTEHRLLTLSSSVDGSAAVDLSHEAMLTAWPAFQEWIATRRVDEERRRLFEDRARLWLQRGRTSIGLFDSGELAEVDTWLSSEGGHSVGHSADLRALVEASRRSLFMAAHRRRVRLRALFAAAAGILVMLSALLVWARHANAKEARARAEAARTAAIADTEVARTLLAANDRSISRAIAHLARAVRTDATYTTATELLYSLLMFEPWRTRVAEVNAGRDPIVVIDPSGSVLAAGGGTGTLALWELQTGRPLRQVIAGGVAVSALSFEQLGRYLAVGFEDGTIQVFDSNTGIAASKPLREEAPTRNWAASADDINDSRNIHQRITLLRFAAGDTRIIACSATTVRIWDWRAGHQRVAAIEQDEIRHCSISPDGSKVVTSGSEGAVLWDVSTELHRTEIAQGNVLATSFSPDGRQLLVSFASRPATVVDVVTQKATTFDSAAAAGVFSPDGVGLITVDLGGTISVWELLQPSLLHKSEPIGYNSTWHTWALEHTYAAFSPDGVRAVVRMDDRTSARIIDTYRGDVLSQPLEHATEIRTVLFSPTNQEVVTASIDGVVRIWRVGSGIANPTRLQLTSFHTYFSPAGDVLLTAPYDTAPELWDLRTGARVSTVLDWTPTSYVSRAAVFSVDGPRTVGVGGDSKAFVADLDTGRTSADCEEMASATFSPDGKLIVSSGKTFVDPPIVEIRDGATGCVRCTLPMESSSQPLFLNDNKRFAIANGKQIELWNAEKCARITVFEQDTMVRSVGVSKNGELLIIGGDHEATVWDVSAHKPIATLEHYAAVTGIYVSPDGQHLLTISGNIPRLWSSIGGRWQLVFAGDSHPSTPNTVVFSSDSRRVLVAYQSLVEMFETTTGVDLLPLKRYASGVSSASFSPSGDLIAASFSGHIEIWPSPPSVERPTEMELKSIEQIAGVRLNGSNVIESAPVVENQLGNASVFSRIASWINNPSERTANPFASVEARMAAERLHPQTEADLQNAWNDALAIALQFDPLNLLILAKQAHKYAAATRIATMSKYLATTPLDARRIDAKIALGRALATFYCDYIERHMTDSGARKVAILAELTRTRELLAQSHSQQDSPQPPEPASVR